MTTFIQLISLSSRHKHLAVKILVFLDIILTLGWNHRSARYHFVFLNVDLEKRVQITNRLLFF